MTKSNIANKVEAMIASWKAGEYDKADEFLLEAEKLRKRIPARDSALGHRLEEAMEEAVEILDQLGQQILKEREQAKRESKTADGTRLELGDLILEPYGLTAIIVKECEPPADVWFIRANDSYRAIHEQKHKIRWFEALVLTGGAVIVAEPLGKFLRKASENDVRAAYAQGNAPAKSSLTVLFPFLTDGN
jgi:hypothetical protein